MKVDSTVKNATRAVIDLGAVSHNISEIRKKIGEKRDLMAIVKADAYGHGAVEVSKAALKSGATCLGIAIPDEGESLRKAGFDVPILVLGLIQPEDAHKVVECGLEQTVCTVELAKALDQEARKASVVVNVHVKVETGMGRIGVTASDAPDFVRRICRLKNLKLVGVFSHFSSADEADKTFSQQQIRIFNEVVHQIEESGIRIAKKHMANSSGILDLPESYYDLVRPGIMTYGLYPSETVSRSIRLRPAMSLRTRVSLIKLVPAGTPISYGRTYYTDRETRVATLPVGYADGYNRLLSNKGHVRVKGRKAPLIGQICMDMCMIDVTNLDNIQVGDEVVLFGHSPTADDIARIIGTINYEVVCSVGKRVPRVFEG